MSDGTKIEWTDATWNVVNGCSVVSPGCKHCYAMKQAHRFPVRQGLTQRTAGGMVWTGEVRFNEAVLTQPLRWKRPRKIFVCAHGDLFHEKVPDEWIDRVFAVMALCPQHIFQVLTKRPERMRDYIMARCYEAKRDDAIVSRMFQLSDAPDLCVVWPLLNVWLGTSIEDQQRADERIPILLDTPAAKRWLSMEPLLGPVDLKSVGQGAEEWCSAIDDPLPPNLDWIVLGGESGPGARPLHPDWARQVRDQCAAAGVPFLFKQWGEYAPTTLGGAPASVWLSKFGTLYRRDDPAAEGRGMSKLGKRDAGRMLDGVQHDGYPA